MVAEIQTPPRPEEAAPPRPWGLLASLGLSAGAFVVYGLIQLAVTMLVPGLSRPDRNGLAFTIPTLISVPIGILLVLTLARRRRGLPVRQYLGLSLPTLAQALGALAPLAAFNLLYDQLAHLLHRPLVPDFLIDAYRTAHGLPGLYLAVVVAGPAFEELLFRGFLLPGLVPALGRVGAALLSSAVFALLHFQYDLFDVTVIFVLGLLFAAVRLTTGSTFLTFVLHGTSNLIALLEVASVVSRAGG